MTLQELKFNGSNGHSRILIMPSREEITFPLVRVGDPTLLDIYKNRNKCFEERKTYQLREIEAHIPIIPLNVVYFARSNEHEGLYLGVQYYRAATANDTLEEKIPVGCPYLLKIPHLKASKFDARAFFNDYMPKGARTYDYVTDICGKVAVVQYFK